MVLRFRRWNRLATADGDSMCYRVLLEIRGFPAHAWSATTAQIILGDACAAPEPTPTTTASADFRCFQTVVWCSDPDLIPNEAVVRIPEKVADPEDNNLFLQPDEIIHHELRLLAIKLKLKSLNSRTGMILGHLLTPVHCRIKFFDSDSDEDYPGFTQHMRSHPFPRRTVIRSPSFGGGAAGGGACSGDGGGSAPVN